MVAVTVAICTHNRAAILPRAIAATLAQTRALDAELLVVDNASSDGTPDVLAALQREAGAVLRVVREDRLGLSAARNRAAAEARGAVVAFLDDDAVPESGWLAALLAPYASERTACVGGRIRLRFTSPPPPWLTPDFHAPLGLYDLGELPRRLHECPSWEYPFGGNVSFRASALRAAGGFSTRLGHRGGRELGHEETDLCMRLDRAGGEITYAPDAVVEHWVLAERLVPRFFMRRAFQRGISTAVCEIANRGWRPALKRFRWWDSRHLMVKPYRPRDPVDPVRLLAECQRREALGYLLGLGRGALLGAPGGRRVPGTGRAPASAAVT